MLINISTDQVIIEYNWKKEFFQINDLEYTLSERLIELYKELNFEDVFLINGPWWFTNLRIWTLCLNTLNSLNNNKVEITNISKIDLFSHLVEKNILPSTWIIYIWQKTNVWEYDFKTQAYNTIKKDEIKHQDNIFLDFVINQEYFSDYNKKVSISYKEKWILQISYLDKTTQIDISEINNNKQTFVTANYFIQPIMWSKWQ